MSFCLNVVSVVKDGSLHQAYYGNMFRPLL